MLPSKDIAKSKMEEKRDWQPRVVVFLCERCSYTDADLTDSRQLSHDSLIETIRVPCSGRVDPLFLLKCFEKGADGVLIFGCSPEGCRYSTGNYHAQKKLATFRTLLEFCGFDARRIHFSWTWTDAGADGATPSIEKSSTDACADRPGSAAPPSIKKSFSSGGAHWAKLIDNVVSQVAEAGPFPDMSPNIYPRRGK